MIRRKVTLYKLEGCIGCTKKCLHNGTVAIKEISEKYKTLFTCNSDA